MADRKLFFTVGADVAPGTREFDKLARAAKKSMGEVDDAVDDSRTNAQRVADALDAVFDEIDSTMKETAETAEVLGRAMGPELASKVDSTAAIQEFQKLGLTLDEIRADADRLGETLKKADDVSLRNFTGEADSAKAKMRDLGDASDDTSKKTSDLGKSADSSKSVLANMVGNSVQDVGALGGVAGSTGVALGQMGEYIADAVAGGDKLGNTLKNFGKVAVPLAGLALATKVVADVMDRFGDSQERSAAAVDVWSDAISSGEDATAAYVDSLKDLGEVTLDVTRSQSGLENVVAELDSKFYTTGIGVNLFRKLLGASTEETKDMTGALAEAGIKADQWASFVQGGAGAAMTLSEALKRTTLSAEDQENILLALSQAQEDYATGAKNAEVITQFFGDTQADAVTEHIRAAAALVQAAAATEGLTEAAEDGEAQIDRLRASHKGAGDMARQQEDRLRSLRDEMIASTGQAFSLEQANLDMSSGYAQLEEATMANAQAQDDATISDRDKEQSSRDLRSAELDLAGQAYATAEAFADQAIKNGDARSKSDLMKEALGLQAQAYPGLREEIQEYINKLNQIPRDVVTNVTTRASTVTVGNRISSGQTTAGGISGARASGGPVSAGKAYLVGEDGPELMVPDRSGTVIPNGGSGTARAASGGTVNLNVVVNAGMGTNGAMVARDLQNALGTLVRVNGKDSVRRLLGL